MELNFTAPSALSVHVMTHLLNFGITTYKHIFVYIGLKLLVQLHCIDMFISSCNILENCNSSKLCQISYCLILLHNPTRGDSTAQPGYTAIMPNGAALKENEKESSHLLKYVRWLDKYDLMLMSFLLTCWLI